MNCRHDYVDTLPCLKNKYCLVLICSKRHLSPNVTCDLTYVIICIPIHVHGYGDCICMHACMYVCTLICKCMHMYTLVYYTYVNLYIYIPHLSTLEGRQRTPSSGHPCTSTKAVHKDDHHKMGPRGVNAPARRLSTMTTTTVGACPAPVHP